MRQPNESIRALARGYCSWMNFPPPQEGHYVTVDTDIAQQIAETFEKLPMVVRTWEVHNAYSQLTYELREQWDYIARMGYTLEPWRELGQPYQSSQDMMTDLRDNEHLYFFIGGESHPFMQKRDETGFNANEQLRAVHDFFGHAAEGYAFGPRGEENAWIHHSMMLSPLAQRALTTETRAANAWVNFGPYKHLQACERPFAVQKAALLPKRLCNWQQALEKEREN